MRKSQKSPVPLLLGIALCALSCLLIFNSCGGSGGTATPNPPPPGKIKHVVIIFQENRTPDNLFHDPVLISRGADIAQSGTNSHGQTIPLNPVPLAAKFDLSHTHASFYLMYDGGKMDGADLVEPFCGPNGSNCPPNPQFSYVQSSDVQPYFQLAEQYTFGDRMFQTNEGPSFPAHQFIISGTSAPSANSNQFAAGNPPEPAGCLGPPGEQVQIVGPNGKTVTSMFPCFEHATITDLLNQAGVSWRYYTPKPGSIWSAPDAIQHMCQPQGVSGTMACTGSDWKNVVIPPAQVLTDIANQNLAQVTWVIPTGTASDHPSYNDSSGPSWVASVVNAIGASPYWSDTAIFITWDDWGGWFDHVSPNVINDGSSWGSGYVYGFRVPLIVISPYAKPSYISHATHDFGSILKFIEETFNLPSLNYADSRADDFSDCFNFTQTPIVFHEVPARLKADFFLNDPRPPTDPDDY